MSDLKDIVGKMQGIDGMLPEIDGKVGNILGKLNVLRVQLWHDLCLALIAAFR